MHKRMKEHLSKFILKNKELRESSAFYKHIQNEHGGLKTGENFESYFPEVDIVKVYQKVLNRSIEEGTFMINHNGDVLNSKTEWNQPRIIITTILQGGAELAGGRVMPPPRSGGGGGKVEVQAQAGGGGVQGEDRSGGAAAGEGPDVGEHITHRARTLLARTSGT